MTLPQVSKALLAALAGALILAGGPSGSAVAASSCGQAVIGDWSADGVVDDTYPTRCYTEAVRELPEDARIYSTAESDILAALSRSVGHKGSTRLLQHAGTREGAATGLGSPVRGSSVEAGLIAALAALGAAALVPLRRARRRRSARRAA
jgi:hypothetical protein